MGKHWDCGCRSGPNLQDLAHICWFLWFTWVMQTLVLTRVNFDHLVINETIAQADHCFNEIGLGQADQQIMSGTYVQEYFYNVHDPWLCTPGHYEVRATSRNMFHLNCKVLHDPCLTAFCSLTYAVSSTDRLHNIVKVHEKNVELANPMNGSCQYPGQISRALNAPVPLHSDNTRFLCCMGLMLPTLALFTSQLSNLDLYLSQAFSAQLHVLKPILSAFAGPKAQLE